MIHKQNLKRVWRLQARMRREARRMLDDPEWCRQAEEQYTHTSSELMTEIITLTPEWTVYQDQAEAWYSIAS